jgi:hypothetical protein
MACTVIAVSDGRQLVVAVALMFSMVHLAAAFVVMNVELVGDCRACCNESQRCLCEKKDPLPPGTLRELARLIEANWKSSVEI